MALRFYCMLDRAIAKNCTRILSTNAVKLAQIPNAEEKPVFTPREKEPGSSVTKFSISSNQRTSPVENPSLQSNSFESESKMLQRSLQNKYLQPATLPTYADKPIFDNQFLASLQEQQIEKAQAISTNNSASQKILENFKKEQMQNPTKKFPKLLSNPFPDPVKSSHSPYIMPDDEKAQQMLDDQKTAQMFLSKKYTTKSSENNETVKSSKKFYGTTQYSKPIEASSSSNKIQENLKRLHGEKQVNNLFTKSMSSSSTSPRDFHGLVGAGSHRLIGKLTDSKSLPNNLDGYRYFSKKKGRKSEVCVNKKKCRPVDPCLYRKCDKITLKGCPPARENTICKKKKLEVKCKKIEAPYPSYSESCYIEPETSHCECKICPWSRKENPNFKKGLQIPPKHYHTDSTTFMLPLGQCFVQSCDRTWDKFDPAWLQTANLNKTYNTSDREIRNFDFYEINKIPSVRCDASNEDSCGKVEKDLEKCKEKHPVPCKGARLPKPIDYLKSYLEKRKEHKPEKSCSSVKSTDMGYCDKEKTVLTEFFMNNENLKTNFRNGDDLAAYGINKGKLSKILASRQLMNEISCKKGERQLPDYPRNCDKDYVDKSKICPTGLTKKKTLKDRLKKKTQKPN